MSDEQHITTPAEAVLAIQMAQAKSLLEAQEVLLALWTGTIANGDEEKQERIEMALGGTDHRLAHLKYDLQNPESDPDEDEDDATETIVGDSIEKVIFVHHVGGESITMEFDSIQDALNSLLD